MSDTTVVIKTIGRPTLKAAIASAKREGFKTLVISDGVNTSAPGANKFVKLGKRWGYYGGMCANVGAALAETEFITFLDDDDVFAPGAGDVIRQKLKEKPKVDVWIGGVRFNRNIEIFDTNTNKKLLTSRDISMNSMLGVIPGNVSMPTYRTMIFSKLPFIDNIPSEADNITDFFHVRACSLAGLTIDWFESVIYWVRPTSLDPNGMGQ